MCPWSRGPRLCGHDLGRFAHTVIIDVSFSVRFVPPRKAIWSRILSSKRSLLRPSPSCARTCLTRQSTATSGAMCSCLTFVRWVMPFCHNRLAMNFVLYNEQHTLQVYCDSSTLPLFNAVCVTCCAGVGEGCVGVPARRHPQNDDDAAASVMDMHSIYDRRIAVGEPRCDALLITCLQWSLPRPCVFWRTPAVAPHAPVGTKRLAHSASHHIDRESGHEFLLSNRHRHILHGHSTA